jgi:hypothetical protein
MLAVMFIYDSCFGFVDFFCSLSKRFPAVEFSYLYLVSVVKPI